MLIKTSGGEVFFLSTAGDAFQLVQAGVKKVETVNLGKGQFLPGPEGVRFQTEDSPDACRVTDIIR